MKEIYASMIILTIKFPEKKKCHQALFVTTCLLLLGA